MTGTAYPETGEALDERNLGEWMLHQVLADYVKRGLGVTADGGANEITVDAGAASIAFDDQLFHAPLDSSETQPYATTAGINYVYVTFDTADGAVSVSVVDTEGAVTAPALLIAEVDGSTDVVTVRNNDPDLTFEDLTINSTITAPSATIDGVSSPYATDPHDNTQHSETYATDPLTNSLDANGQDVTNVGELAATLVDADTVQLDVGVDVEQTVSGGDPITIDVSQAGVWEVQMDQDATINLTGADAAGVYTAAIVFEDNGFTPTWDTSIVWEDDTPPELNDEVRLIQFFTRDDGTTWGGRYSGVFPGL